MDWANLPTEVLIEDLKDSRSARCALQGAFSLAEKQKGAMWVVAAAAGGVAVGHFSSFFVCGFCLSIAILAMIALANIKRTSEGWATACTQCEAEISEIMSELKRRNEGFA